MRRRGGIPNTTAGVLALAACIVAAYAAWTGGAIPFRDDWRIEAVFTDARGIAPGSPVRIAGVDAGEVTAVRRPHEGEAVARVELQIAEDALPLHRDAEMTIRPRILLEGNFFVDVRPGTPDAPRLADGDVVPVNQTASAVQLGDVLSALQTDTRQDLQRLLDHYARALRGGGAAGLNRSMRWWAPAYRGTAVTAEALLGERPGDLRRALRSGGDVAAALDRDPVALGDLLGGLRATAAALARAQHRLAATLDELPPTMRVAMPALRAADRSLPAVRALARDAAPGVRTAPEALDATLPLVRELRALAGPDELGGLAPELRAVSGPLAALARATPRVLDELRSAAGCTNEVLVPWSGDTIDDPQFPAIGPVYQELPQPFVGAAGESRSGDANGQWIRAHMNVGNFAYPQGENGFLLTTRALLGTNPPKPARRPGFHPDVPCETQDPPDLRTRPGPAPDGLRVATDSPAARAVRARGLEPTLALARRLIRRAGLREVLDVSDRLLEAADLPRLPRPVVRRAGR